MLTQDYFAAQKNNAVDPFQGLRISAAIPQDVPEEHLFSKLDQSLDTIAQLAEQAERARQTEVVDPFIIEFIAVLIGVGGDYPHVEFSNEGEALGYEFFLPREMVKQLGRALYRKVSVTFTILE